MARYTKAYSAFTERLGEIETLCSLASLREKRDPIGLRKEINALSRSSIVLLSGRLEAYIKELGEIALDSLHAKSVPRTKIPSRLYYHISKDKLNEIRDTSDPEKIAEKVFLFIDEDLLYWSRDTAFPQEIPTYKFNRGFATPTFEKIRGYLKRFGYQEYRSDLKRLLRNKYVSTVNLVDHLVDTRNKIAHGDPQVSKTPSEITSMITTTKIFCRSTDNLFAKWWKNQFCSIR